MPRQRPARHESRPPAQAGTPATVALERAGVAFVPRPYDHDPQATSFGLEAAHALGVDPATVFKTLVVTIEAAGRGDTSGRGELAVALVPVDRQLDLKALAAALGAKRATMADPAAAQRSSGYVVGGISPIGQRRRLRTVLDETARSLPTVLVSGGRRGFDLELSPDDLARVTGATFAAISR